MSAFFAAAYSDRVELLTDGAIYDDDGVVIDFRTKVWTSDALPLAFAGRGGSTTIELMGTVIDLCSWRGSVDGALRMFAERLESRAYRGQEQAALDGVIAGISETDGPVLYYFHTYKGGGAEFGDIAPFRLHEVSEMLGAPHPSPREYRESGLPMFWACDGLAEHGPRLFDLLRRNPLKAVALPGQPLVYGIGGHVDHTVLRAESVVTERIHEWPDDVMGERIVPAPPCTGLRQVAA